ncbi:MAG: hypothetical protein AAF481_07930 [Acidobacteriota bacterium]
MSTEFEFFEGTATVQATTPQVTVRRSGQLVLTEAAVALLGEGVEAVQIGYNAQARAIGLRPAPKDAHGALKLRKQPNGRSRLVDARRFFAHHGLKLVAASRADVEGFGEGLVGFHLTEEGAGQAEVALTKAKRTSVAKGK